jgi:hypothetical protein
MAQGIGPKFKRRYHKTNKQKTLKNKTILQHIWKPKLSQIKRKLRKFHRSSLNNS